MLAFSVGNGSISCFFLVETPCFGCIFDEIRTCTSKQPKMFAFPFPVLSMGKQKREPVGSRFYLELFYGNQLFLFF